MNRTLQLLVFLTGLAGIAWGVAVEGREDLVGGHRDRRRPRRERVVAQRRSRRRARLEIEEEVALEEEPRAELHRRVAPQRRRVALELHGDLREPTAGRLDAYIADIIVSRDAFLSKPEGRDYEFTGPEFSDPKWFGDGIGVALRKQDDDLTKRFNQAIAALVANGTYQKIAAKYPDFDAYLRK